MAVPTVTPNGIKITPSLSLCLSVTPSLPLSVSPLLRYPVTSSLLSLLPQACSASSGSHNSQLTTHYFLSLRLSVSPSLSLSVSQSPRHPVTSFSAPTGLLSLPPDLTTHYSLLFITPSLRLSLSQSLSLSVTPSLLSLLPQACSASSGSHNSQLTTHYFLSLRLSVSQSLSHLVTPSLLSLLPPVFIC